MRSLAALALLLGASAAAPTAAAAGMQANAAPAELDPERLAIATEIVNLSFPPERRQATLLGTIDTMTAQAGAAAEAASGGALDEGARRIVARHLQRVREATEGIIEEASPRLFTAWARAYARHFTREELVQIRAFVATPTGAKYAQQSSAILSDPDFAQANTAYMAAIFAVLQPMQVELQQELREYIEGRGDGSGQPTRSR